MMNISQKGKGFKRSYSLKEICKIMGIKCPKQFKTISDIQRDNITLKKDKVTKGAIFFAGYDEIEDNKYFDNIVQKGAEIIFVDQSIYNSFDVDKKFPIIVVDNLMNKQGKFFAYVRRKYKLRTIAITGSVGKTTTKQLLNCVVSKHFKTYTSIGNYNSFPSVANNILYELDADKEIYIQETGAAAPFSVEKSAIMLEADAYILTNILPHHLNYYHNVENVLKDKTSHSKYLKRGGVLVTNYDDDLIRNTKFHHKVITFGIVSTDVDYRGVNICQNNEFLEMDIVHDNTFCHVKVNIVGKHNAYNILAAFALCKWLNIDDDSIKKYFLDFKTRGIRQNIININGIYFYIDCYNVCNASIKAGIDAITEMKIEKENKKIAIIGGENKLGKDYEKISYQLGKEISNNKLDYIICYSLADNTQKSIDYYGESKPIYQALIDCGYKNVELITNQNDLIKRMKQLLIPGDLVLIKGNAELDITVAMDKLYGTSLTMDFEYKQERNFIVENDEFVMKVNSDFNAGVIKECKFIPNNKLIIPNKINNYDVYKVGARLFRENDDIVEIEFGNSLVNIGFAAFARCHNLKKIVIPSNVKWISESAFANCSNLETVILEEGVTNLRKNAFYNNSNLREVYLPDSLKYIDKNAFTKCSNLLIICNKNTLAEKFAIDNKLMIKYRKD